MKHSILAAIPYLALVGVTRAQDFPVTIDHKFGDTTRTSEAGKHPQVAG